MNTDKDMRKLSRIDLLEMFLTVSQENESLTQQLNASRQENTQLEQSTEHQKAENLRLQDRLNAQAKTIEYMQKKLAEIEDKLADTEAKLEESEAKRISRDIDLEEAGSIAEAAMKVNGIFEAAEATAKQYLDNIKRLNDRESAICESMREQTLKECEEQKAETRKYCDELQKKTKQETMELKAETERETQKIWELLGERMDQFIDSHEEMRDVMGHFQLKVPSMEKKATE